MGAVGVAAEQDTNERTMVERRDPLLGAVFDRRFRVDAKLAAGGFGAIYRATHLKSGHEFALKVLHANLTHDSRVVARFRREGEALTRLRDPHTITAYEIGEAPDGTLYIVMELLHGETLYERLRIGGPLPWRRSLQIARAVCSSLAEAHAHGIVHRDLKPTNIHLEPRGNQNDNVKVLDFGIAKLLQDSDLDASELTQAGQMIGTLDYMSPEQMVGGLCTATSDIYTLGIVMYEMIAGRKPFDDANSAAAALAAVLTATPQALSAQAAVTPDVDHVVMRCLERQHTARYQSATELAAALDDVLLRDDDLAISVVRERADDATTSPLRAPVMIPELPPDPQRAPTVPLRARGSAQRVPGANPGPSEPPAPPKPAASTIAALASHLAGAVSQIATIPRSSSVPLLAQRALQIESPAAPIVSPTTPTTPAPRAGSTPQLASRTASTEPALPPAGSAGAAGAELASGSQIAPATPIVPRTRQIELPMPQMAAPQQRASSPQIPPAPPRTAAPSPPPPRASAALIPPAPPRASAPQIASSPPRVSAPRIEPQVAPASHAATPPKRSAVSNSETDLELTPWTPQMTTASDIATEPHVAPTGHVFTSAQRVAVGAATLSTPPASSTPAASTMPPPASPQPASGAAKHTPSGAPPVVAQAAAAGKPITSAGTGVAPPPSTVAPGDPKVGSARPADAYGPQVGTGRHVVASDRVGPQGGTGRHLTSGEPYGPQSGTGRHTAPGEPYGSQGGTGRHTAPGDVYGPQVGTGTRLAAPRPRGNTPLAGTSSIKTLREAYPTIHHARPSATRPPMPAFDELPTTLVGTAAHLAQLEKPAAQPRDPSARRLTIGIAFAIMLIAALIANWLTTAL